MRVYFADTHTDKLKKPDMNPRCSCRNRKPDGEEGEEEFVYKVVPNDITLKLPAARSVEDNPVHKTKILTVKENNRDIKVGDLMYNSFTAGTNSDPDKYNNELRQISQEFKTAGVKYVILDLRKK